MTVSGSSNKIAAASARGIPRPSEIFCLASGDKLAARRSSISSISSSRATSSTRALISAGATPRFLSGKARFSRAVIVS